MELEQKCAPAEKCNRRRGVLEYDLKALLEAQDLTTSGAEEGREHERGAEKEVLAVS